LEHNGKKETLLFLEYFWLDLSIEIVGKRLANAAK
jgi:hypothetical protein